MFISIIVPRVYLASAIGLNSVSWNMSRVVGPGVSGFAIVILGLANTFGIALLSYIPLIITLSLIPLHGRYSATSISGKFFEKLREEDE